MQLRGYQLDALEAAWRDLHDGKSPLIVEPTGAGKTIIFVKLVERWLKKHGGHVLVIVHRRDLVNQAREQFKKNTRLSVGLEMGEHRASKKDKVVCASVQSMSRRLEKWSKKHFGLVITDEADLAAAETHRKVLTYFSSAKRFGCTATPNRHDGESLGDLFDEISHETNLREMVQKRHLVAIRRHLVQILNVKRIRLRDGDYDPKQLDEVLREEKRLHEVVKPLLEITRGRQTLVFGMTVLHAKLLAEVFNRYRPSSARAIDGTASSDERAQTYRDFEAGKFQFLCNCALVNRGVDLPFVSCVGIARPTLSRPLYMQMLGRGTRLAPKKRDLLVVDFTFSSKIHDLKPPLSALQALLPPDRPDVEVRVQELIDGNDGDQSIDVLLPSPPGIDIGGLIKKAERELAEDEELRKRVLAIVEYRRKLAAGINWSAVDWANKTSTEIAVELGISNSTVWRYRPKHIEGPWRQRISEAMRKVNSEMTPEQRRERLCKARRELMGKRTFEQRSEAARKASAAKTPEQRSEAARKANAAKTSEQRSEAARKANAAKTSEQRSEAARKAWVTKRKKK